MTDTSQLEPITLPHWPSSTRCLTSSEDDLAVACGEHVHVLTPRGKSSTRDPGPHPHWHINSIRINRFSEQEWPTQSLATLRHLSLGEEQSNSIATDVSWSPKGLGLHVRSVLAVLTSNLILALWETDGTIGILKRTCIINKYLHPENGDEQEVGFGRRAVRVRAFSWLPALNFDNSPKYGMHHLAVANDDGTVFILAVSKTSSSTYGNWSIKLCIKCSLPTVTPSTNGRLEISPLKRKLFSESTVSEISSFGWEDQESQTGEPGALVKRNTLKVVKGRIHHALRLSVSMNRSPGRRGASDQPILYTELKAHEVPDSRDTIEVPPLTIVIEGKEVQPEMVFRTALKPLLKAFDQEYGLYGHHTVRFWGACRALGASRLAACVTLHPSDMIEHNQPSNEKCVVVFAYAGKLDLSANPDSAIDNQVHQNIVQLGLLLAQNPDHIRMKLDIQTLKALFSLTIKQLMPASTSQVLEHAIQLSMGTQVHSDDTIGVGRSIDTSRGALDTSAAEPIVSASHDMDERCEICSSSIPFSDDTGSATCSSGHQFTRCNLSFLAVQQPGISKYCSGCGRQFLDLVKLGMQGGLSFTNALFDHFDVCPYCGAKFRG